MSFLTVLTIVFVVLKLMGIIAWSWFFVLLPSVVFVALYLVYILALMAKIGYFRKHTRHK